MEDQEFAGYVRSYTDAVYRVAFHACKNPADSQDIVQNVFLRLYRASPSLRVQSMPGAGFSGWR